MLLHTVRDQSSWSHNILFEDVLVSVSVACVTVSGAGVDTQRAPVQAGPHTIHTQVRQQVRHHLLTQQNTNNGQMENKKIRQW